MTSRSSEPEEVGRPLEEPTGGRNLRAFTGRGYDKGRGLHMQVLWFVTLNLVFTKWWFPPRLRPYVLRSFGARVGERVLIRHRVRIQWPWKLVVGDDCWIGEGVWFINLEEVVVEENVCISQEALVCTGSHLARDPAFEFDNAPIRIAAGSWIAARAIVLRGAVVPPDTVVPAGSVYRRSRL